MQSLHLLYRVIITDNTLIGILLVMMLAGMTTIAALMARKHRKRYSGPETNYLNQVKTRLRNLQLAAASSPVPDDDSAALEPPPPETFSGGDATSHPGADSVATSPLPEPAPVKTAAALPISNLVSVEELAISVPLTSIIGDRLQVIALLRKSQAKVNLPALQQISRAREAARTSLRFPGLAVNLAMMVGLLGTFIGIAIVIQQIGFNMSHGDGSLESFGNAFSGMYTKFSTTLVGLACAIVLATLNFRLAQAQELLFEDLDRFTVSELLPATVPVLEDETLLDRVSRQLEDSFTLIQEVATENAKTAQEVSAIQAGFADIVANLRQQSRNESSDRIQNLIGQVSGVVEQVGRVNESLKTLATALPLALSESNRNLERAITPLVVSARTFGSREAATPGGKSRPTTYFWVLGAAALCVLVAILVKMG